MAPVTAQVTMTFLDPAMSLVFRLSNRWRSRPSGAEIAIGATLMGDECHQPAIAPDLALLQAVGGEALAAVALDLLQHRAGPIDSPLLARMQPLVDTLIALDVVAGARRGV